MNNSPPKPFVRVPAKADKDYLISISRGNSYRVSDYTGGACPAFSITDDNGDQIYCLEKDCAHLSPNRSLNWEWSDK